MIHITGETGLTGLLGSPVAHSISPLMHNYSFQSLGLDYVYLCFDVKEQGLKDAVQGFAALNVKCFNLTMPDKNKVLEHLDELSCASPAHRGGKHRRKQRRAAYRTQHRRHWIYALCGRTGS